MVPWWSQACLAKSAIDFATLAFIANLTLGIRFGRSDRPFTAIHPAPTSIAKQSRFPDGCQKLLCAILMSGDTHGYLSWEPIWDSPVTVFGPL